MISVESSTSSPPRRIDVVRRAIDAEIEFRRRKRAWSPAFRGSSLLAQSITDHEWVLAGPAETSKTWACCWRLDTELRKTPGAAASIVRKVREDMGGTVLRTFERLAFMRGGVKAFGGKRPEWYEYDNGAIAYVGGMDRPGKVLSGERDFFYINQLEELTLSDFETITGRATGRGARTDHPMVFADCNPDAPSHWILKRPELRLLPSRHEDNPSLYDDNGNLTAQGERTMAILDSLTGVRRERLRFGRWVAAEGVVYDGFSRAIHVVRRGDVPPIRRWIGSIDWGFTNPSVFQLWGIDGDGRMYLWRELYKTQRLVQDFAEDIKAMLKSEGIAVSSDGPKAERSEKVLETIVADHDAEDRATLHRCGLPTRAAIKEIGNGIQKVQARLRIAGDGKPRVFYVEDAPVERDAVLLDKHLPTSTVEECEVYAWPKGKDGRPVKEVPVDLHNHGCDAKRYAVEYVDRSSAPELPLEERVRARVDATGVDRADLTARHLVYERERAAEKARTGKPRLLPTTLGRLRFRR